MKTAIIGVGNPLRKDDGLGVHLAQNPHPTIASEFDVIDAGASGLALLRFFQEYDRLIILDAVKHKGIPGDVITFVPGESGRILVSFIIENNGRVQKAQVQSSTLGNPRVESCIEQAATFFRFPPVGAEGIVVVTYPFEVSLPADGEE